MEEHSRAERQTTSREQPSSGPRSTDPGVEEHATYGARPRSRVQPQDGRPEDYTTTSRQQPPPRSRYSDSDTEEWITSSEQSSSLGSQSPDPWAEQHGPPGERSRFRVELQGRRAERHGPSSEQQPSSPLRPQSPNSSQLGEWVTSSEQSSSGSQSAEVQFEERTVTVRKRSRSATRAENHTPSSDQQSSPCHGQPSDSEPGKRVMTSEQSSPLGAQSSGSESGEWLTSSEQSSSRCRSQSPERQSRGRGRATVPDAAAPGAAASSHGGSGLDKARSRLPLSEAIREPLYESAIPPDISTALSDGSSAVPLALLEFYWPSVEIGCHTARRVYFMRLAALFSRPRLRSIMADVAMGSDLLQAVARLDPAEIQTLSQIIREDLSIEQGHLNARPTEEEKEVRRKMLYERWGSFFAGLGPDFIH